MTYDRPVNVKTLFRTTFIDLLPKAQEFPFLCADFYKVAPDILWINADLLRDETTLRILIHDLSALMLQTDHQERFGSVDVDHRVPGLCALILSCVHKMKSLKEPLQLGSVILLLEERDCANTTCQSACARDIPEVSLPDIMPRSG